MAIEMKGGLEEVGIKDKITWVKTWTFETCAFEIYRFLLGIVMHGSGIVGL